MRKHWLLGLLTLALVFGASAMLLSLPQRESAIARKNFDRIQEGMTEAEVEAILGGPPGKYTDRPDPVLYHGIMFHRWWIGEDAVITIEVDVDESDLAAPARVSRKFFSPYPPESILERCSQLLPW